MSKEMNLIWIDLEMTGLNPDTDVIIEIATVVTDAQLNVIAEGPVIAVHQSDAVMNGMDEWCTRTHGQSGLTERVRAILGRADHHVTLLLPYAQGALLETLHRDCAVLRTDYRDDGIALEVIIHPEQWPRLEPFVIPDEEV